MLKLPLKISIIISLLAGQSMNNTLLSQTKSEYFKIITKFEQWKSYQYKADKFATENNCMPDTVSKDGYKGPDMGIPKNIDISFTDINNDNKIDALITFHPDQCDGGNALMNAQIQILILSKDSSYFIDDKYISKIERQFKKGRLNIERASYGAIYGTYYEYKSNDGRCCPSIHRTFAIDYSTKKLTFDNDNK
jgi:hypothetical protein